MYEVRGKVVYKDGSVPSGGVGSVQFVPTGESNAQIRKGASGKIRPDGSFELFTQVPGDGVYAGEYDVTFALWKGVMDPTSLIQAEYTNSATTPYKKIQVDGDIDDLVFEIEPLVAARRAAAVGAQGPMVSAVSR